MPVKIDQETTDGLVADAFAAHSLCGCKDVTHPLAAAAHAIIVHEVEPKKLSRVWTSQGVTNERHVHSAFWRALWVARRQGLCSLVLSK